MYNSFQQKLYLFQYETTGSVLNSIKNGAAEKNIFRMLQCEPKSKRKMFREEEKLRHSNLSSMQFQDVASVSSVS